MIEVFKIVHITCTITELHHHYLIIIRTSVTRGNKFKLQNQSFNHNLKKVFFSARTVNIWNSLPNYVVDMQSIDVFKVHLDKFWAQQEILTGLQS